MEYWQERYEAAKQRMMALGPIDEILDEDDQLENEEREMWDYNDVLPNSEGDYPRFPNGVNFEPMLFNWLPWGVVFVAQFNL
jgi:hypothetical protein